MDVIFLKIRHEGGSYGKFTLSKKYILEYTTFLSQQIGSSTFSKVKSKLELDGIFVHYFIQELKVCDNYRRSFIENFKNHVPRHVTSLRISLKPPSKEIIDYEWNYRIDHLVQERCELEHALSWLSTLGGAFSALGDYYVNCAEIAGKISVNQFKLALKLQDESVASRCRLFFSLSLIQQKRYQLAKHIIYREYLRAKYSPVLDSRLIKMCKGIWSKLQYEYKIRNKIHKNKNTSINIKK